MLTKSYIEQREAGYWVAGTRISLDSVVYSFLDGESPESIAQNFPLLSLLAGVWRDHVLPCQSRVCGCLSGSRQS